MEKINLSPTPEADKQRKELQRQAYELSKGLENDKGDGGKKVSKREKDTSGVVEIPKGQDPQERKVA